MVQVLPETASFGQQFGRALGSGLSEGAAGIMDSRAKMKQMANEAQAAKQQYGVDISGYGPEARNVILKELARSSGKRVFLEDLRGDKGPSSDQQLQMDQNQEPNEEAQSRIDEAIQHNNQDGWYDRLSDSKRQEFAYMYPTEAKALEANRMNRIKTDVAQEKRQRDIFESERGYHTQFSKDAEKETEALRSSLPKKAMSLDLARNAVESGDLSYFSADKLADITGIDAFRTAKGVQLVTAGKENLLSNISRVSSRAQNMWMEQRMNSMFAKIGQSPEANLTAQTMLEGEVEMDQAYLSEFDRLTADDEKEHGFVRKDVAKRARNNVKQKEKDIFQRTSYRLKELEEVEQGLNKLTPKVGKNVIKGTPLTLAMAKLYKNKFGDHALSVAKKNGYYIPSVEEFAVFQQRPQEFREAL